MIGILTNVWLELPNIRCKWMCPVMADKRWINLRQVAQIINPRCYFKNRRATMEEWWPRHLPVKLEVNLQFYLQVLLRFHRLKQRFLIFRKSFLTIMDIKFLPRAIILNLRLLPNLRLMGMKKRCTSRCQQMRNSSTYNFMVNLEPICQTKKASLKSLYLQIFTTTETQLTSMSSVSYHSRALTRCQKHFRDSCISVQIMN